jgi:hypothetical protein
VGVRSPEEAPIVYRETAREPSLSSALALAAALFVALVANGRPIGSGDTRVNEHVAASLAQEHDFDLDEYPEVEPPFAREVAGRRLSIYPVLSPLLAAPLFAAARLFFALDERGAALAGKLAAALFSAAAAGVLYVAVGRRHTPRRAAWAAILFALGTSTWSVSQALWQHPAALLALSVAVLFLLRAEEDPAWAGRAGLPLACAAAARHADIPLVLVLVVAVSVRWPRRLPQLALFGLAPVAFVLGYDGWAFGSPLKTGFPSPGRFGGQWGEGQLALLISPGRGLLAYTPVALAAIVGLVRAFRQGDRWLASALAAAAATHWLFIGQWAEWHGGQCWGPRMLTDALPLLFVFLPEGFGALPRLGPALAVVSVAVQALGAFAYDGRWERLHQPGGRAESAVWWDPLRSPILAYAEPRVAIFAAPRVRDGRVHVREHRAVLLPARGSRVHFEGASPVVTGSEETLTDVHLLRGARVEVGRLELRGRGDGLFLRVPAGARPRRLELRVSGAGSGLLYVGEDSFSASAPRWSTYPVSGRFLVRHPYHFPESGGADLVVTVGRAGGDASLDWLALVAPSDPISPLRLP